MLSSPSLLPIKAFLVFRSYYLTFRSVFLAFRRHFLKSKKLAKGAPLLAIQAFGLSEVSAIKTSLPLPENNP